MISIPGHPEVGEFFRSFGRSISIFPTIYRGRATFATNPVPCYRLGRDSGADYRAMTCLLKNQPA